MNLSVMSLQDRYEHWRRSEDGQKVYKAVLSGAVRLHLRGFRHYGIAALYEGVRYDYSLQIGPDMQGFKLNNNWRSRLARDIMREHPFLDGFFETRDLKA